MFFELEHEQANRASTKHEKYKTPDLDNLQKKASDDLKMVKIKI
jgi:Holliday junction resolvase RusA-like endonuclease